jgi:hypothetical protein
MAPQPEILGWLDECRARFGAREHLSRPHVIEAILAAPVAIDPQQPIMLEGALQCAAIAAVTGRTPDEVGLDSRVFTDVPIPIADGVRAGLRVARCSAAEGTMRARERYVRRRPRSERYALPVVRETLGEFKAWSLPMPTRLVSVLRWHAFADPERLFELLPLVQSIGRSRQAGLGQVAFWRMLPEKTDRSWLNEDGNPARPLPVASPATARAEFGQGVQIGIVGYRAPYWHVKARALCALPGGSP